MQTGSSVESFHKYNRPVKGRGRTYREELRMNLLAVDSGFTHGVLLRVGHGDLRRKKTGRKSEVVSRREPTTEGPFESRGFFKTGRGKEGEKIEEIRVT